LIVDFVPSNEGSETDFGKPDHGKSSRRMINQHYSKRPTLPNFLLEEQSEEEDDDREDDDPELDEREDDDPELDEPELEEEKKLHPPDEDYEDSLFRRERIIGEDCSAIRECLRSEWCYQRSTRP
jgi:hypothetical protein